MDYIQQLFLLLGVFLGLSGIIAYVVGRRVRSFDAGKTYFLRSMILFPLLLAVMFLYFFLKHQLQFKMPTWVELIGLVLVMFALAAFVEGYFSKKPVLYHWNNQLMVITSTRHQFNLDEVTGIEVEGERIVLYTRRLSGKTFPRYIRICDTGKRKWLLKQIRNSFKEYQNAKKRS